MALTGGLFEGLGKAAQRALALLSKGKTYYEVYRNIREHFAGASQADIRSVIATAKEAQAAVDPNKQTGRYRQADIPVIGPPVTEVPLLTGNQRYTARGIVTWTDPGTGEIEHSTVFSRYSRLPRKAQIEADLREQAIYQQGQGQYPGKISRTFDESTMSVDFVSLTRAF